jgi:PmbA protein
MTERGTPASENAALDVLERTLAKARAGGADAADAVLVDHRAISATVRLGKRETLERSDAVDLGLRVFIGHRQSLVATSDLSEEGLRALTDRAIAMARVVPEDPFCGLADPAQLAHDDVAIDLCDDREPDVEALIDRAFEAEAAALAVPGVSNSEGAETSWAMDSLAVAATNGFARAFRRTRHSLSASVLAGEGTAMERDYEYASAVHAEDLSDAALIGRTAGERAVRRLRPRKAASAQVPVVYEPRAARSLLGHLAMAISGPAINRQTSFLLGRLGMPVFAAGITITDDPLRQRGLRSRPFDAEGLAVRSRPIVDKGVLTTWLLDLRSGRQLQMESTGHAARGPGSLPSPAPSNLAIEPGNVTPEALIADVEEGFYVSELMGFGINGVTGDYSRGASGFWILRGELAHPVSEVTISGNLIQMFGRMAAANDLVYRYGIDAPSVRIEGMTVAGR